MSGVEFQHGYDAFLIDTSIFDRYGLRLESGLLGELRQFKDSPVDFVFPDVVRGEVVAHLEKNIKVAKLSLEKAINKAGDNLFFDGSNLEAAKKLLIENSEIEDLAVLRVDNFVKSTGALEIDCGRYVSISEVLSKYFMNSPPFAESGKKKQEFPDAIVLMAVEKWAVENGKTVLAIADDKDWESYCNDSGVVSYQNDLSKGMSEFNQSDAILGFVGRINESVDGAGWVSFVSGVEQALENVLGGFTPDQYAESQFYFEADGANGWYSSFSFVDFDFRVVSIDIEGGVAVIEALAEIVVEAEGEFSLSATDSVDRDLVSLGSVSVLAKESFETEILIHVSGDMTDGFSGLIVEEVEVVDLISEVNFGTLEPVFW